MDDAEKQLRLESIASLIGTVADISDLVDRHLSALEAAGVSLPNVHDVANRLTDIAQGWRSGAPIRS